LEENKINLTDVGYGDHEVDLLIGSDIGGQLLTGKLMKLDCGLVMVDTYLGATLMGKFSHKQTNNNLLVNSMLCTNSDVVREEQLAEAERLFHLSQMEQEKQLRLSQEEENEQNLLKPEKKLKKTETSWKKDDYQDDYEDTKENCNVKVGFEDHFSNLDEITPEVCLFKGPMILMSKDILLTSEKTWEKETEHHLESATEVSSSVTNKVQRKTSTGSFKGPHEKEGSKFLVFKRRNFLRKRLKRELHEDNAISSSWWESGHWQLEQSFLINKPDFDDDEIHFGKSECFLSSWWENGPLEQSFLINQTDLDDDKIHNGKKFVHLFLSWSWWEKEKMDSQRSSVNSLKISCDVGSSTVAWYVGFWQRMIRKVKEKSSCTTNQWNWTDLLKYCTGIGYCRIKPFKPFN